MTYYTQTHVVRTTNSGKQLVGYRYWESFGRDTGYARSWGCREQRGTGLIWLQAGETLDDAIARRRAEYAE